MTDRLPLFPLGTVLFPGMLLPLNIFEDRYKQLVRDLLDGPEPRRFGVIAIKKGRETEGNDDGGYEVVAVGTQRFRLDALDESRAYLQGEVEFLAEDEGDSAAA